MLSFWCLFHFISFVRKCMGPSPDCSCFRCCTECPLFYHSGPSVSLQRRDRYQFRLLHCSPCCSLCCSPYPFLLFWVTSPFAGSDSNTTSPNLVYTTALYMYMKSLHFRHNNHLYHLPLNEKFRISLENYSLIVL